MEIKLLDTNFEAFYILDNFRSFIWTDRYWEAGDFEIVVAPTSNMLSALHSVKYAALKESPHHMIIEDYNLQTDIDDGNSLIITGRSIETILSYRIPWVPIAMNGNLQTEIQRLLNDNVINPTDSLRDISNFIFNTSSDTAITSLTVDSQFSGSDGNIYDIIAHLCKSNGIGFKIIKDIANDEWDFTLYAGKDRSYSQSVNEPVAFTKELENLISSDYIESNRVVRTVCLVAASAGVANEKTTATVFAPNSSTLTDLARKELYLDSGISRNTPDGELTEAELASALQGRGKEELAKWIYIQAVDGEIDTTMYKFGDDFEMGDILQIADEYGHEGELRVVEMTYSQDDNTISMYPTFGSTY